MQKNANRIKELRLAKGWSQERLGDAVGATKQQIGLLESGKRRLTQGWMAKIAEALECHPADLLPDSLISALEREPEHPQVVDLPELGPASIPGPATEPVARHQVRQDVPVLGTAQGGSGQGDFEINTGEVVDFTGRPPRYTGVRELYALYLQGDSMEPWARHGQKVYVHAKMPYRPRDRVVIQLQAPEGQPTRAYVKELVKESALSVTLRQYNPPRDDLIIPRNMIKAIHRVLEPEDLF